MNYHDLDEFSEEIESVEQFFTELAAREDEVLTFGIVKATQWDSFEKAQEILPKFEARIHEFLEFVRPVNKQLFENVQALVTEAKLVGSIASIQVSLRIAAERRSIRRGREIIMSALIELPYVSRLFQKKRLFSEEVVSIQTILVALGRLKNLVTMAGERYIRRWTRDSDVFRPSNLDEEKIISHIEIAIYEVENNLALPEDEKKQLAEYLYKAKIELAEDRPSWNRIIGALVVTAAITGGIATAPQAYENIDAAIKYILGTSIQRHIPEYVPLINSPRLEKDDSGGADDTIKLA